MGRRLIVTKSPNQTRDPRELPAYTVSEAAQYLSLPAATVRYWSMGRASHGPLITVPAKSPTRLSFLNLVELHVLAAIRRDHRIRMAKVRKAIRFLGTCAKHPGDELHPLISRELAANGLDLLIQQYDELVNIGREGQMAMREIISAALRRIERDSNGVPIRLYPYTRSALKDDPALVVIDPTLSAGRPVIAGTGLATEVIAERYRAGESVSDLVQDYERNPVEIEEAIRYELQAPA